MNIYDIAKEAGVSISTVSRVMNNKGNVNAATRKKVEAILDKHDYTPSAIARGMVSKTMKTVAVLTVDIRVPHMRELFIQLNGSLATEGTRSQSVIRVVSWKRQPSI